MSEQKTQFTKAFSEPCLRNRGPILEILRQVLPESGRVLEIGCGTGQHAVYFTENLPNLKWQPTDRAGHLDSVNAWVLEQPRSNLLPPQEFDVDTSDWTTWKGEFDAVFTANSLHIMGEPSVERFFAGVSKLLSSAGSCVVYGPFNYGGNYTSDSNRRFDQWLKDRDPKSGIRDFEWVNSLAEAGGLALERDVAMPANNRILVWKRQTSA